MKIQKSMLSQVCITNTVVNSQMSSDYLHTNLCYTTDWLHSLTQVIYSYFYFLVHSQMQTAKALPPRAVMKTEGENTEKALTQVSNSGPQEVWSIVTRITWVCFNDQILGRDAVKKYDSLLAKMEMINQVQHVLSHPYVK